MRSLHALAIGLVLALAAPAKLASAQFKGLDLGSSSKKKSTKKKKTKSGTSSKPAPADKDEDEDEDDKAKATQTAPATTTPAAAVDDKPKKAAPTMTFEGMDVTGKSADRQRLDVAQQHFKAEEYDQAALSSYEIMQDPKMAALHMEAHYLLAKALYRLGMYHGALSQFSKILARGPQSKFFKTSLEWLFYISNKTVNESVVLDEIARYSNFEFPEKFRNEFRYLLARYHFVRGRALDSVQQKGEADKSFDEVKRLVLMIPRTDGFYPRAKYLEGLAQFRDGNYQGALESMKEIVRLTRPGASKGSAKSNQELRELAFMQLARTHYGARQNRYAIYYYAKIDRGTSQWLESLFEASWANYRIGQYEQALGNLITLSSPFFREEYFPEALILKAVIYYENCRYKEAVIILEDFERLYMPVHDQLDMLVNKQMEASEYYNVLHEVQKKKEEGVEMSTTDVVLERILRLALTDKDFKKVNDSILELEAEMESITNKSDTFKFSNLSKQMIDELKVDREELIKKAGVMARAKLSFELGELKKLLGNALRIKFETTTKEKEFLEKQLAEGANAQIVKKYRYSVAVGDEQLYWPYVGEYWRDELGTYQYTLTKGCIERDTANKRREERAGAGL